MDRLSRVGDQLAATSGRYLLSSAEKFALLFPRRASAKNQHNKETMLSICRGDLPKAGRTVAAAWEVQKMQLPWQAPE